MALAGNILLLLAIAISVNGRGNIDVGSPFGAFLIYHEVHEKGGIPLVYRNEEVFVKGVGNEIIRGINVQDLKGNALAHIKEGGLGYPNVTIELKSGVRGDGYKYLVDVFAI